MEPAFCFRLIVDAVKANHALEEDMKFGMCSGIPSHFKKREEYIYTLLDPSFYYRKYAVNLLLTISAKVFTDPLCL